MCAGDSWESRMVSDAEAYMPLWKRLIPLCAFHALGVWIPAVSSSISAIAAILTKTLIRPDLQLACQKAQIQPTRGFSAFPRHPRPLFFLYLLLIFLHPLPCPLTNRLMWRTGMFRGWQFWQLRVERWAIKGFNWHSWVSHISLKWCENCESPAIIRMLRGGEKMDKGIEDRLVGNGTGNLEEDARKRDW